MSNHSNELAEDTVVLASLDVLDANGKLYALTGNPAFGHHSRDLTTVFDLIKERSAEMRCGEIGNNYINFLHKTYSDSFPAPGPAITETVNVQGWRQGSAVDSRPNVKNSI